MADIKPWEPLESTIIEGTLIEANTPTVDGLIFTEECLADLARQAKNLEYKDGVLKVHGPIKVGKVVIEYEDKAPEEKADS